MRGGFKTKNVTLKVPWERSQRPRNRQLASWLHDFLETRRELLADPGIGAGHIVCYRLEWTEVDIGLGLSGCRTPSQLLRRVIHTYRSQGVPQSAPVSRPAQQAAAGPASPSIPAKRLPQASSRLYPTDGRKVEIAVEDVHKELKKLGYREMPQATSRYFRQGKKIIREEGGKVLKVYEGPE